MNKEEKQSIAIVIALDFAITEGGIVGIEQFAGFAKKQENNTLQTFGEDLENYVLNNKTVMKSTDHILAKVLSHMRTCLIMGQDIRLPEAVIENEDNYHHHSDEILRLAKSQIKQYQDYSRQPTAFATDFLNSIE